MRRLRGLGRRRRLRLWRLLLMLLLVLLLTAALLLILRVGRSSRRERIHQDERKARAKSSQHARTPILGGLNPLHVSLV